MATKVKPSRLQVTWTPQAWNVPVYVDQDTFQWWAGGWWGSWDVVWPNSATDGNLAVFDGTTWKLIKDWWAVPTQVTVVDNLTTQSSTSALSANQGYVLDGKIADLMALWKFLSLWNATTGQPISFPLQTPYTYSTWDYFLVETVSTATPPVNYKPNGSSYTGTASSTTESDELEVGDVYIYDWTTWLLQSNHWKTVSFTNIAGDAMDNVSLSWYLNTKAFYLSSSSDLTTAQAAYNWQNLGKTAIIIYNDKPYMFTSWNATSASFWCIFYKEQWVLSPWWISKTSLVRDTLLLSLSSWTVTSINAIGWNDIMASVLKTDTDYPNPYTPQYDGSPATKKYVDDKHGVISVTLAAIGWSSKSITVAATWVTASNTVIVSPAPANINDYASNSVYCSAQGSGTLTFSCNTEPTVDIVVNILTIN